MEQITETFEKFLSRTEQGFCTGCGTSMTVKFFRFGPSSPERRVDVCEVCQVGEQSKPSIIQRQESPETRWMQICPRQYQMTDATRIPDALKRKVLTYCYSERGIFLSGATAAYKTRVIYLLMKKLFLLGKSVLMFDSVKFGQSVMDSFKDFAVPDYTGLLHNLEHVDCLFIDDLGQGKLTERAEEALFAVVERRMQNMKPTFFTTNLLEEDLLRMFSEFRGPAILRRITESTDCYGVGFDEQGKFYIA